MEGLFPSLAAAAEILRLARDQVKGPEKLVSEFYQLLEDVELHLSQLERPVRLPLSTVVVEGLDGCGKSTLVTRLASSSPGWTAVGTPTASMRLYRPCFDSIDGSVARAFYMVSNYFLQYELFQSVHANNCSSEKVVVIDRFYTTTCAYSVANATSSVQSVDATPSSIFAWPTDLFQPSVVLILEADETVRRDRVTGRAAVTTNDWDERLHRDPGLGNRIVRALFRVCPTAQSINANGTPSDVLKESKLAIFDTMMVQQTEEATRSSMGPWDLCEWLVRTTDRERVRMGSTIQRYMIAENGGLYFFQSGVPPTQITIFADKREFGISGFSVPVSCRAAEILLSESGCDNLYFMVPRYLSYCNRERQGGDLYWERASRQLWKSVSSNIPTSLLMSKPITLAMTGTHCAGKTTVGQELVSMLDGWFWQEELGDVLRSTLQANGHRQGSGDGSTDAVSWDEKVRFHELARDTERKINRVVETWHVGNAAWASFLRDNHSEKAEMEHNIAEHMKDHIVLFVHLRTKSPALMMERRRKYPEKVERLPLDNDEEEQCTALYKALDVNVTDILWKSLSHLAIPQIVVDNSSDGISEKTIRDVLKFIHKHMW